MGTKKKQMRIQDYDEKRTVVIKVRATPSEKKEIEKIAEKENLSVSELIRKKLMKESR